MAACAMFTIGIGSKAEEARSTVIAVSPYACHIRGVQWRTNYLARLPEEGSLALVQVELRASSRTICLCHSKKSHPCCRHTAPAWHTFSTVQEERRRGGPHTSTEERRHALCLQARADVSWLQCALGLSPGNTSDYWACLWPLKWRGYAVMFAACSRQHVRRR
jgi:hypothetical protein